MLDEWDYFAEQCLLVWKRNKYTQKHIDECRDDFFPLVRKHIEIYVIPQYGHNDVLSSMPPYKAAIACECAIEKYIARKDTSMRPDEKALDCFKRAHYAQLKNQFLKNYHLVDEDTIDVCSAFEDWRKLSHAS